MLVLGLALLAVLVPPGPAGPPSHGRFACDAVCKLLACRELAKSEPPARRVNAVAECMTFFPCPAKCSEGA